VPFSQAVGVLMVSGVVGWLAIFVVVPHVWASSSPDGQDGQMAETQRIVVNIENRRFVPHVIRLRVGQQIRLVLRNDDAELHAFVPTDLLANTNVQVEGNGAPQFNGEGFHRVLIPSKGQAKLTFSPKQAGSFPFLNGTVVVED